MTVLEQTQVEDVERVESTGVPLEDQLSDSSECELSNLTAEQQLQEAATKKSTYNRRYYKENTKKKRQLKKTKDETVNQCIEELKRHNAELLRNLHESEASKIATDRKLNAISVESQQYRQQLLQYQQQQYQQQRYHTAVPRTSMPQTLSYQGVSGVPSTHQGIVGSTVPRRAGLPVSTGSGSVSGQRMGQQHAGDSVSIRQQNITQSPVPRHTVAPIRGHGQQYTTNSYMQHNRQHFAEQRR